MRVLVACLAAAAALAVPAAADRFRTVLVGGSPDWASSGGDQGCDICSGGHGHEGHGHQSGGYSSSSRSSRYSSSASAPSYRSRWPQSEHGLLGRSGAGQRTTMTTSHYEESEYTFSNGTHSTTITSKRSSQGVPEFHLRMTRLRDGAIIESTVLSEYEYQQRRAELGLTGSDGSFGFESLGGAGDLHGLSTRTRGSNDLLAEMERRLAERRGGGRHSSTSFSSEESFYSFSNGTHTTSITGRRNSDGVREYRLELIRDSDRAVLDRATISEAEYNRRRDSMVGGEGFTNVFDIHGIRGSGSRTSESEFGSSSRQDSRYDSRYGGSSTRSGFGATSEESEYDSRTGGRRPSTGGSRSTYYREERRESSRREEASESCSCVARSQCDYSERVYSAETLQRCESGEVCCRRPREEAPRPLLPQIPDRPSRRPIEYPRPRPVAEPQVRSEEPDCSCVPRSSCTYAERDFTLAGLQKCSTPMVCCKRQLVGGTERAPVIPTRAPTPRHTTLDPAYLQQQREEFRDIVQHVTDTHEAPPVRPHRQPDLNALQDSLSRYDDRHAVSGSRGYTQISRSEHSRTESSSGRPYYPAPVASGGETTSSSRRYSYSSRSSTGEHGVTDDLATRPVGTSDDFSHSGSSSGLQEQFHKSNSGYVSQRINPGYEDKEDSSEQSGSRVISSRRHYTERRVISGGDNSGEYERPLLDSGSHSRYEASQRTEQQLSGQEPVDLPGAQLGGGSSSRHYSYRSSSSSTSGDLGGSSGQLLGSEDAAAALAAELAAKLAAAGGSTNVGGSGGGAVTSEHRYSERRVVSGGDAGAADLGLGVADLGLAHGVGHGGSSGGYSSGYKTSSSWSSRSESGSAGALLPTEGALTHPVGSSGGSSYRYSSRTSSSHAAPLESGSSYWSGYSQQNARHRRGWTDLFRSRDEAPPAVGYGQATDSCVCVRFDRCSDGNLLHHGADLLDFSIGTRKQCSGFRVCCDTRPEVLRQLESTPGLQPGVIASVPTAGLHLDQRTAPLAPHVSSSQPCVCVSAYLCQGGKIGASQQLLVDMRQVSQTGRCSYDGQVCCAVPWAQVAPTAPPPPCTCVPGNQCRQQDILTRYTNANAPTCPGTQVCCARPPVQAGSPFAGAPVQDRMEYDTYLFCKSYPLSVACASTHRFNFLPTIQPTPYFNADADARQIKDAIGYFTVDDDVLIRILTRRTFQERNLIKQAFKRLTGSDLADKIESRSTGNYEDLMLELLDGASMEEYLAIRLHEGMDRLGTDEDVVLETLISSTNDEINAIKPYFYALSGHTLENDIDDDFTGDLEDILVALANGTRDSSFTVNRERAREQANALRRAGDARLGTEEETFKYYLTHENYAQLALIFSEYEQLAGETFEEALEDEFSRHTEEAVLAIVEVTKNLPAYFAGRLYDALWGRGPVSKDDSSLRRILISRAERDLGSIAQEYQRRYGNSLRADIETKSTSDYEDALVSLLGQTP